MSENLYTHYRIPVIAFVVGLVMMTIELVAARIVAPYVGSSVYTWTAVIGAVLSGSAAGSYIGGKFVDAYDSALVSFWALCAAAFFAAGIPLCIHPLATGVVGASTSLLFINLAVALLLFFPPALFLGAVSPALLKRALVATDVVGRTAGKLSALWSAGSIVGTFLTGFVFVEYLGTMTILFIMALVLVGCAAAILPRWSLLRGIVVAGIVASVLVAWMIAASAAHATGILYSAESGYYSITLVHDTQFFPGGARILFLDADAHSVDADAGRSLGMYTDAYPLFSVFAHPIHSALVIGGGSYSIAKHIADFYKPSTVDVVEIDPAVTGVAEKFFNIGAYPTIHTIQTDGRLFLNTASTTYSLIFGDAYNSFVSIPWYLGTREATERARDLLAPGGAYIVNFISAREGPESGFFKSMGATFGSVFGNAYVVSFGGDPLQQQNIFLIGVRSDSSLAVGQQSSVIAAVNQLRDRGVIPASVSISPLVVDSSAPILTDEFAPVERLMAPVIQAYFPSYMRWRAAILSE